MDRLALMDINRVGPGIWFKIHTDAIAAKTQPLKESFVVNINVLCDSFKCKHCQPHFRKYINEHPIENYFNIKNSKGIDIGIFQWTWEFHNAVNLRLGKYQPTLEECYEYYTNNTIGACHECGQNKDINIKDDNKTFKNNDRIITIKNNDIIKNTNTKSPVIIKYEESNKPINHSQKPINKSFKNDQSSGNKQSFPFKMYDKK